MSRKVLITIGIVIGMALLVGGGGTAIFLALDHSPVGRAVRDSVGGRTFDQADVDAALLTEADLPGYSRDVSADPSSGVTLSPCGHDLNLAALGQAGTDRTSALTKTGADTFILNTTGLLAKHHKTLRQIRDDFANCPTWTQGNGDGYTATEVDYGSFGDETYSLKVAVDSEGVTIGINLVFIRRGNLISMLAVASFPELTPGEVSALAGKAADQLPH